MKIKRHKHTKRVLKYYESNFGLDTKQVNILIDGTLANEALKSKINLADQMPKYFDLAPAKCKLLTTKCAINETKLLGKPTYGAMLILQQYELVECLHKRQYVSTEKCFKKILTDSQSSTEKTKYFVATQVSQIKTLFLFF
jgi:rRNA-processing protein FCF1